MMDTNSPPSTLAAGTPEPLRICIFGANPETGNLGVTALAHTLIAGIARRAPGTEITVVDDQPGVRTGRLRVDGNVVAYRICAVIPTRRVYKSESLFRIRRAGRRGESGGPALEAVRQADAVLDITAGDGFTDIYGRRRFDRAVMEKRLVLEQGCPLILPPQTIGPFLSERNRRLASAAVQSAAMVWTRDQDSFDLVRGMVGSSYRPERHRLGVDLAFGLDQHEPHGPVAEPAASWLETKGEHPLVGINVSGLLYNAADAARNRFGLRADYRRAMVDFVSRLLQETNAHVLLVPHVMTTAGDAEHDPDANRVVVEALARIDQRRLVVLDPPRSPGEAKWIIGHCDWFCATRMHAAITALSAGVPSAAVAYSRNAAGVFETCGQEEYVIDARRADTTDIVNHLWWAYKKRDVSRERLAKILPDIRRRAQEPLDEIVSWCQRFCHRGAA